MIITLGFIYMVNQYFTYRIINSIFIKFAKKSN